MQLGRGDVKFTKNIYVKLIKRGSKMQVREESKIHIHKVSLGQISMHKDMLTSKTSFNDHHIQSINVIELDKLKDVNDRFISLETNFIELEFLVNPRVAWKGCRRELFSDLTRFSRRRGMRNKWTINQNLDDSSLRVQVNNIMRRNMQRGLNLVLPWEEANSSVWVTLSLSSTNTTSRGGITNDQRNNTTNYDTVTKGNTRFLVIDDIKTAMTMRKIII